MTDIAIIGGGASGIISAISAKIHNPNASVTVFEKSPKCLKKLLMTGSGRCNILNTCPKEENYHSQNTERVMQILNKFSSNDIADFFIENGLALSYRFSPLVYPASFQASSVRDMLLTCAYEHKVKIFTDSEIVNITDLNNTFCLHPKKGQSEKCKKIIFAGGTNATSGSNSCFSLLKTIGHKTTPLHSALVALNCRETDILQQINGARAFVKATLLQNGKSVKSELGEVQFASYGLSGIVIMQLSGECVKMINNSQKCEISLSFFENQTANEVKKMLLNIHNKYKIQKALPAVCMIVNSAAAQAALHFSKIDKTAVFSSLSDNDVLKIATVLCDMRFSPTSAKGENFAQVLGGGVTLDMFDNNLCSKINKNIYAAGEVLDVYGDCGGYNLTWAWSSGYICGKSAALSLK